MKKENEHITNLINIYESYKKKYPLDAYKHLSDILSKYKETHKEKFIKDNQGKKYDHEQSWRAVKGKNLEKLIKYIIETEVEEMGLKTINGNKLERSINLDNELDTIKRNLCIDYGEYGLHLPDVDIIIYNPNSLKAIAVISIKVTLRERIAQTGYWKLKLLQSSVTKNIKVFFMTLDEDSTLSIKHPTKKGRAICEIDTDGCYVLSISEIEESGNVKSFSKFIDDLKVLIKNN